MEYGEQCVVLTWISLEPQLCVDNWGLVSIQVKVRYSSFIKRYCYVATTHDQKLPSMTHDYEVTWDNLRIGMDPQKPQW